MTHRKDVVDMAPVESKVTAASTGAAVAGLALWFLGAYAFPGGVPEPVEAVVMVLVPGLVAFVSGWLARHTPRPDLPARVVATGRPPAP